jgi:hypothetical protein
MKYIIKYDFDALDAINDLKSHFCNAGEETLADYYKNGERLIKRKKLDGGEPEPWILEQLAHSRGSDDGMRRGREQGLQEGYDRGYKNGYAEGNTAGYNEAIDEGNTVIERMQAKVPPTRIRWLQIIKPMKLS